MSWLKRNDLLVYLFLAFLLSWWPWPFTLANPAGTPMVPFGPLLAALIVLSITSGWTGVKALLKAMARWRVSLGWYAVAFLVPLGLLLAAIYLNVLLGAEPPNLVESLDPSLILTAFLTATLIGGGLTEEPGWRGFALPRLQKKNSPVMASLILGLIWFSWHLPLLINNSGNGQRPPLQFFVTIMGMSIIYTWLYNGTRGSVLLAILMHGAFNGFGSVFMPSQFGENYSRFWWLFALLWWAAALAVIALKSMRRTSQPEILQVEAAEP